MLYPTSKGVIAQTQIAKEIFSEMYHHNNIEVIGNPIREIASLNNEKRENIVLTVGRLISTKHHDELIRMFSSINKPDWKLIIIGEDALRQKNKFRLEKIITELNIKDKVILAGKKENVDEYYLKSKIFAFTSSSEGFPNVVGEAMAAGLPVVAFDCISGPSDMITDNINGYLVPLLNFKLFQEKLCYLMENDNLRIKFGENAKSSIKKYSSEVIATKYKNFIRI